MSTVDWVSEPRHVAAKSEALVRLDEKDVARGLSIAIATGSSAPLRVPWWLWWNVLSLDAPMVAVAWLAMFARAARVDLAGVNFVVLGAIVWCIYASDRLLDGWKITDRGELRQRHLFCAERRRAFVALVGTCGIATLLLIAERLSLREMVAGAALAAVVGGYLASIHADAAGIARKIPKEIAVGVVFACGTTLPLWSRRAVGVMGWGHVLGWGCFALLCCLNTLSIECWEGGTSDGFRMTSEALSWMAGGLAAGTLAATAVSAALGGAWVEPLAVASGAAFLLVVHVARSKFSAEALRVLADAALLVPPVAVLLAYGSW